MGSEGYLYFELENQNLVAKLTKNNYYNIGESLKLKVNAHNVHLFDIETKNTIL